MVTTGFVSNQAFVDLIRALTATEARSIANGVTTTDNSAVLVVSDGAQWTVSAEESGYSVTLPDGRAGTGTTVANALAAAKAP